MKSLIRVFVINFLFLTLNFSNAWASFPNNGSFSSVIEPTLPTVVNIYTVTYSKKLNPHNAHLPEFVPFNKFNEFFQKFNLPLFFEPPYTTPRAMSLGSGFIVDAEGHIMTNDHVIAEADEVYVKLPDNSEFPATIIGSDSGTDLALLKIDTKKNLPFVKFGDSTKPKVGDWVFAIGNPLGFGSSVTAGIVSSTGRDLGLKKDELVDDFIQTDAAINNGNSGGPLFNMDGQVIGMNTSIASGISGTNIGIGFAIPSNTVQIIMKQLKEHGKISRGRLDIAVQDINEQLLEAFSLDNNYGVLVVGVLPNGSGDKAGLKSGDLITEFNGEKVLNSRKLQIFVSESNIGDEIRLTILRGKEVLNLLAEIVEMKEERIVEEEIALKKSGIIFSNLSRHVLKRYELNIDIKGIAVLSVNPKYENLDLRIGDLVTAINQEPITNVKHFGKVYDRLRSEGKQSVVLLVKRRDISLFVALPIEK